MVLREPFYDFPVATLNHELSTMKITNLRYTKMGRCNSDLHFIFFCIQQPHLF